MQIKELGHVVLYVTDLERSRHFYRDHLGFRETGSSLVNFQGRKGGAVAFSSGRTHHELLLIEVGGQPREKTAPEPGLYHIGFKVGDSSAELKKVYQELKASEVPIIGTSDHTVTQGIYILDPDGNTLELYVDVSDTWREKPELIFAPTGPLNLE